VKTSPFSVSSARQCTADGALRPEQLAEAVRGACLQAAIAAYEAAGSQGLCAEGRWEVAVGALRALDLHALLEAGEASSSST